MSKYAFYCYDKIITFYNLELSTFCNNLISLIVSYFNKIGVFLIKLFFTLFFLSCKIEVVHYS